MSAASWADAPYFCTRFESLPRIVLDALPPGKKEAARIIRDQATAVARKSGAEKDPVLAWLKSNNRNASYLVAYVPAEERSVAVLFVHSFVLKQTHSLVDLPDIFVVDLHERVYSGDGVTSGFTYKFFNTDKYVIQIVDTETHRIREKPHALKRSRFHQRMEAGYSYGGLPSRCRRNQVDYPAYRTFSTGYHSDD